MTMKVMLSRITPWTTSVMDTAQIPPRNVYRRMTTPVTIVTIVISSPITGASSLHVEASWTPPESVKFSMITHPRNCCVVTLKRVYVYSTGEMERVRRQREAVICDPK